MYAGGDKDDAISHLKRVVEESYGPILETNHKAHRVPQDLQTKKHSVDLKSSLQT